MSVVKLVSRTIVLAAVFLPSYASAQAPPGPGQGGYGWVPVPRPFTFGLDPSDFDWTGLRVVTNFTDWNGNNSHADFFSFLGLEPEIHASFGGASGLSHVDVTVNGYSGFVWQWTPPHDLAQNPGDPDCSLFPADQLYLLGMTAPFSALRATPGHVNGLSGAGSAADQWGWHENYSLPGQAPASADTNPRRGIVAATAGTVATAQLSPFTAVGGTGTVNGDTATAHISLFEAIDPILLLQPDVLGHPEKGDGKNQFVYDSSDAGLLTIPVASAASPSIDDLTFLSQHLDWTLPGIDGQWPYQAIATTSNVVPFSEPYQANGFAYFGLPVSNSSFGTKTLTMTVDAANSQRAKLQTFFLTYAFNHPNQKNPFTANWYYYYQQVHWPAWIYPVYYGNVFGARTAGSFDANGVLHCFTVLGVTAQNE